MACIIKDSIRGAYPALDRPTSGLPPVAGVVGRRGHGRRCAVNDSDLPLLVLPPEAQEPLEPPHFACLGDLAAPEDLLPGGVLGAGALFSAHFFRTRAASSSSSRSADWSRELHNARALGTDNLANREDSSELSLAGASSAFVVATSAEAAVVASARGGFRV
jgi:hypothetical protein